MLKSDHSACGCLTASTSSGARPRSLIAKQIEGKDRAKCAREARDLRSATDVVLLEHGLVARLVLLLDVVKERAARGHELQEAAARMIVLAVGLEVLGEVGNAFRQDRDLNLWRTGVTGLLGIRLDDFRFAFCGNRHRHTLSLSLRPVLAVSPDRLKTRLGMSSPLPSSARAKSRPATVT